MGTPPSQTPPPWYSRSPVLPLFRSSALLLFRSSVLTFFRSSVLPFSRSSVLPFFRSHFLSFVRFCTSFSLLRPRCEGLYSAFCQGKMRIMCKHDRRKDKCDECGHLKVRRKVNRYIHTVCIYTYPYLYVYANGYVYVLYVLHTYV
jgi:hypothetical protein